MKNLTRTTLISLVTVTALSLGAWATCSDDVDMGEHNIINVADPINDQDVATKAYVDGLIERYTDRYSRNDDKEIVTDKKTNLLWQDNAAVAKENNRKQWLTDEKYALCKESADKGEELDRCEDNTRGETAAAYCANLELGGFYYGWRVPTKDELKGIVRRAASKTISDVFQHTNYNILYWTSSSIKDTENDAWAIDFYHGNLELAHKNSSFNVRCVRNR